MPASPEPEKRRVPGWPLAALLAFATLILYWPATECGFVNYDDNLYVTANVHVQNGLSVAGIRWDFLHTVASNWHPLTLMSHQLDCQLFGRQPWGPHLTSVLLHAVNVALVFGLLHLLTRSIWRSLLVAALFATHPLHVESVAWVSERKDVLSGCFGLLALIFYARYALRRKAAQGFGIETPRSPSPAGLAPDYLLALVFLALGLMSKAMLVTWPFVLLLLDYWPLRRFQPGRLWALTREKIPFFLLIVLSSIITLLVQRQAGAMAGVGNVPLAARAANAVVAYGRYLGKLFCPTQLAIFYPLPAHWPALKVLVAGALLAGLSLMFYARRRSQPYLLVGWLWFLGTLVPVIGLVQVGEQSMADRYAYLPSLGILVMVVWGAASLTRRWSGQFQAMAAAGGIATFLCAGLTWQQIGYWQNSETLFRHDLAVVADNQVARGNLGAALEAEGKFADAITQYQQAIGLQPGNPSGYYNLGNVFFKQGKFDDAIGEYQQAIQREPNDADALVSLGSAYYKSGQLEPAVSQYQSAIRLEPENPVAHYDLGKTFLKQGDTNGAIGEYESAIRLNPRYAEAHNNLGFALQATGRIDEAIHEYQTALELNPNYSLAQNNLQSALVKKNRPANP